MKAPHIFKFSDRDWTEDFVRSDGTRGQFYSNTCRECKESFFGHKYRSVCKSCVEALKSQQEAKP